MAADSDKATAMWVVRRLRRAGFAALFAGGCVRDMLLDRPCSDYDVATDATPQQVAKLFRRTLLIGAAFGVAMVMRRDKTGRDRQVEVATFRSDVAYTDGRRPDEIVFSTPQQDAQRRDFTINGLFYDPLAEEVIDYVDGRADIEAGVVRTIGRPGDRFAEDYLRMLRAVRFARRLGFHLDEATAGAIRKHAPKITRISGERIFDELAKMLRDPSAPEALRQLAELGLAGPILPELFEGDEDWRQAVDRIDRLPGRGDDALNFGVLLCDLQAGAIGKVIRRWGASNELKASAKLLAGYRETWRDAATMPLCDFKRLMSSGQWDRLRTLWKIREKQETDKQRQAYRIARRAGRIAPGQVAPEPFVTGADVLAMGVPPGPAVGRVLREVYDAQLDETLANRDEAIAMARERVERDGR